MCPNCGLKFGFDGALQKFKPKYHCPRCKSSQMLINSDTDIKCYLCSLTFDKSFFGRIPDSRILAREEMKEILAGSNQLSYEYTMTLNHYCQFYLAELQSSNNLDILHDMQPLITRLLKQGEYIDSYWIQSHTYLVQGQMALLEMNMGEARNNITKAQEIAEDHGLQLLAQKISNEYDKLLKELDKWEDFKRQKAPVSERLNLVSINETIDSMQRRRAIKFPESVDEESMLLLILGEGGILMFSYPFTDEWKFDESLFGGFLNAINSISDEIFSEGLDRVIFGQQTVLLELVANFSVCYLFKGETYHAKQKVVKFAEQIQKNTSIQQTLNKYYKTSQVLELKDSPSLENLITDIFLS